MSNVPPPPSGGEQWPPPPPPGGQQPPPPPPGGYAAPPPQQPAYGAPQQPQYGAPMATGAAGAPLDNFGRPMAEWWKRAVAYIVDGLITAVPSYILMFVILGSAFSQAETETFVDPETGFTTTQVTDGAGLLGGAFLLGMALFFVIPLVYFAVLNGGNSGQTVGKKVMKIQVRDEATGGPIGIGRGFLRYFIIIVFSFLCSIPALIDLLSPLWDSKRQSWHDKIAKSNVIDIG